MTICFNLKQCQIEGSHDFINTGIFLDHNGVSVVNIEVNCLNFASEHQKYVK